MKDGDFEIRFEDEDDPWGYDEREVGIRPQSRAGWVVGLGICALSPVLMLWLGWLAWVALRDQDPYTLLGLAVILVAAVAFHALRGHWWEDEADVMSKAWLSRHRP